MFLLQLALSMLFANQMIPLTAGLGGSMAALLLKGVFLAMNLDAVIISAIMPMVPGVTFTSAIRDTLNGDYSSGVAKMAEAVVVALAVAFGVGAAMMAFRAMGGSV